MDRMHASKEDIVDVFAGTAARVYGIAPPLLKSTVTSTDTGNGKEKSKPEPAP